MNTPRMTGLLLTVLVLAASCGGNSGSETPQAINVGAPTGEVAVKVGHVDVLERLIGGKERRNQREAALTLISEEVFAQCVGDLGFGYEPTPITVTHPENALDSEIYPNGFGWANYLSQTKAREDARSALLDEGLTESQLSNCDRTGREAASEKANEEAYATLDAIREGWQQNASLRIDESSAIQSALDAYVDCMNTAGFDIEDRVDAFEFAGNEGWDGSTAGLETIDDLDQSIGYADAQCWTPVAEVYIAEQDVLFEAIVNDHQDALEAMDGFWDEYAEKSGNTKPSEMTTTTTDDDDDDDLTSSTSPQTTTSPAESDTTTTVA